MKILSRIISLFCLALLLTNCKKDHSTLGVDVQPKGDALNTNYNATASVYAYTLKYDSTACGNDRYKFLGSNQDPYFGRMDVGMYLNSTMNLTFLDFGADATIRSSEIILAVDNLNYAGDPQALLTYSVFAIDSTISVSRTYYTNNTKLHNSKTLVGTVKTAFSLYNGKPVIRIPISLDYSRAILNNPAYLVSNDIFQATYKGFYIVTSGSNVNPYTAQGIIYKCDLEDDVSGFYLNYQNGTPSATKTDKSFKFIFSGSTAGRYNTVKYSPNVGGTNNLIQQVLNKDTTQGSEDLYLKGLGVTKVRVYIPDLNNYIDSNVSINRAEVIFNVDAPLTTTGGQYAAPVKLSLLPLDSLGRETYAADQLDNSRYDGSYDGTLNRYVFNIARHAQRIAERKLKNYGFYLVVANTDVVYSTAYDSPSKELIFVRRDNFLERVILAGNNKGALKPQCNITYVKLKNR